MIDYMQSLGRSCFTNKKPGKDRAGILSETWLALPIRSQPLEQWQSLRQGLEASVVPRQAGVCSQPLLSSQS